MSRTLLLLLALAAPHDDPPRPAGPAPETGPAALFLRQGVLVPVRAATGDLAGVLAALAAGPPPAAGLASALPPGTRLLAVETRGGDLAVTFSAELLGQGDLARRVEEITAQVVGTVETVWRGPGAIHIQAETPSGRRRLEELLPPPPPAPPPAGPEAGPEALAPAGALAGRTIALSPGHGLYWNTIYNNWIYQRPLIDGLVEDVHNNEIVFEHLIPYLENLGARVVSCRERQRPEAERFLDNDGGAPVYVETGSWATGSSTGWQGRTYRYAGTAAGETAAATWRWTVPRADRYGVYVFFRAGANRTTQALFRVGHAGGAAELAVDQTRDDRRWLWLGAFPFDPAAPAAVTLSNRSPEAGKVVVADAVRIGGGLGDIDRGGGASLAPRWREAARYWTQTAGAPPSVYQRGTGTDNGDDVTTRPAYAEWRGADAFLSHHTNAGGGTGTSSYIYSGGATAGSAALQDRVHRRLIADIRASWDPAWTDRGMLSANFGEVRELKTMPGVLLELAFHDDPQKKDHAYLHDPAFRRLAARAIARGVLTYFQPAAPFPPEPPAAPRAANDGRGGVNLAWEPAPGASGYLVEASPDGLGFLPAGETGAASWGTGPLPPAAVRYFRIRAFNATGRSLPTEVVGARAAPSGRAPVLVVNGFDRVGRYVKEPENTFDYVRLHGRALAEAPSRGAAFDSCANEAVALGRVRLGDYRVVDWLLGEESQQHETFSAQEQFLVTAYLQNGGALLVTGAELAWDLDAKGSSQDRLFLQGILGARYVADAAGTYSYYGLPGTLAAGLKGAFDDGSQGTYDVDYADVLAPAQPGAAAWLAYQGGAAAAVAWDQGTWRTLAAGFPLETATTGAGRADLADRALRFLDPEPACGATPEAPRVGKGEVALRLPGQAGRIYFLAAALGREPAIPLPGGRYLPLAPDPLFLATLGGGGGLFSGFSGTLDGSGRARAEWGVPNLPELQGLAVYFAGFTVDPAAPELVGEVSDWARTVVR